MLNRIWFWLIVIGVVYAPAKALIAPWFGFAPVAAVEATDSADSAETGSMRIVSDIGKRVTTEALNGAKAAVTLCINLIGPMVLWLGLMQVAKDAGLVDAIAWLLRPVMRWLFPEVPEGHPAHGAMLMNISANMLNLGNAATPFGLKAMKELEELNTEPGVATNPMAMFLAINTSSVTIVPFTIIGLRAAADSVDPAAPLFGILLATLCSTLVAVTAVRLLSRMPVYAKTAPQPPTPATEGAE